MTLDEYISKVEKVFNNSESIINEILSDTTTSNSLKVKQRMRQSGPFPSVGQYKNGGSTKNIFGTKKDGDIKLYNTGDFNKSLFIEFVGRKFQMDALDKKRELLVEKYGINIFNLKSEEIAFIMNNFVITELQKDISPGANLTINI